MKRLLLLAVLASSCSYAAEPASAPKPAASAPAKPTAAEQKKLKDCTAQANQMGRFINNQPVPLSPAERKEFIAACMKK